jgi:hypothetical protein
VAGGKVILKGVVAHPDGKEMWAAEGEASVHEAENLGLKIGQGIRRKVPPGILPEKP